ncbi:hypothetical protein [Mycolicibacterium palauense]|uniref:hypothetical protein n=1 Tax=Mycolicibacterium palauense TaxID=2034511 RepID=UPI001145B806|nr:hypothetical protein [Mycolicibacterium palauense]
MQVFESNSHAVHSPQTPYFIAAAFLFLALTQLPLIVRRGESFARFCYWGGTAGAAVCALIAAIPDWVGGIVFSAVTLFAMTLTAYFATHYIKIAGKVYTFHIQRDRSQRKDSDADPWRLPEGYPDAYGTGVTAAKMWWLLVPCSALCTFTAVTQFADSAGTGLVIAAVAAIVLLALGFGYFTDGSWGYPPARGQYVQFALVSILSAGVFAVFYLLAYATGRRWPLRNKKSLEYRAHSHFHEK